MNFLVLLNHGPGLQYFYKMLGNELKSQGHHVVYSLESRLNNFLFNNCKIESNAYFFTDFMNKANRGEALLDIEDMNAWQIFVSDFDRFEWFGVNLHKRGNWYRKIFQARVNYFTTIMKRERIDAILAEPVSSSINYIAFLLSKKIGVKYVGIVPSRIPGRYELHPTIEGIKPTLEKTFELLSTKDFIKSKNAEEINSYLNNFIDMTPDYMKHPVNTITSPFEKYFNLGTLRNTINNIRYLISKPEIDYPFEVGNPLKYSFRMFCRRLKRFAKIQYLDVFSYSDMDDLKRRPYFLYPMHYHPESSTSVHASHHLDEYQVIRNISFNIPFSHSLYVKAHPSAHGFEHLATYDKIKKLPNVEFLSPNENTKELIKNSSGVITLTSTVGYEAIILRKPVVVIGNVFYDFFPGCVKINSWDDLFPAAKKCLEIDINRRQVRDFITAYFDVTFRGNILMSGNRENFRPIAKDIVFFANSMQV